MDDNEFLRRIKGAFQSEAEERLKSILFSLTELENPLTSSDRRRSILEVISREFHSLKGASRVVNMVDIEEQCRSAEETFSAMKRGEIRLSPDILKKVHQTVDRIQNILINFEKDLALVRGVV